MYESHLLRGSLINLIGLAAKLVQPVFLVAITWLFGTDIVGQYFLAIFIAQVAAVLVSSGYDDATLIFASRYADEDPHSDELYVVLSNALGITALLNGVALGVAFFGAESFVDRFYPGQDQLAPALKLLAWSVPFTAISSICIAATKAVMRMEYDAFIRGFLNPVVLLGLSVGAFALDWGLMGLLWSFLIAQIVTAVASVMAYARHFSLSRTVAALRRPRLSASMLWFAIPQNVNMTFSRYSTRLDVIMLGAFGVSNHLLAYYSAAALVTSNLREIKMVFAGALAPIIARHHAASDRPQMETSLNRVTRWTTTLIVPAVLVSLVMRDDVLLILDAGYGGDSLFVVVLMLPPLLSCTVGLAGNCIVWTRHTAWNLVNSVLNAALNTTLNLALIPTYGVLGAAVATASAALLVSALQLLELYRLEGIALRMKEVGQAYLGFALLLPVVLLVGDPGQYGSLFGRVALAMALAGSFFSLMFLVRHPEIYTLGTRLWRRAVAG